MTTLEVVWLLSWAAFPTEYGYGVRYVAGGAALAGVGFTVSLFITGLAFTDELLVSEAKMGILGGSALSAVSAAGFTFSALGLLTRVARHGRVSYLDH